jgi:hypothetical protein
VLFRALFSGSEKYAKFSTLFSREAAGIGMTNPAALRFSF